MKVSERIRKIRELLATMDIVAYTDYGENLEQELIQLEVDVVVALQTARQESYQAGHTDGYNQRKAGF